MAAHRFWRLFILRTQGAAEAVITELVLATTPGGPQAAVGGTATASSQFSGTNTPSMAFNGVTADSWATTSSFFGGFGSQFIQYAMPVGSPIDVVEIRILLAATAFASQSLRMFQLLYSDDGINWKIQRAWADEPIWALGENRTLDATEIPPGSVTNRRIKDVLTAARLPNSTATQGTRRLASLNRIPAPSSYSTARQIPWSGQFYIAGSTTVLGEPISRRVRLYEQFSGLLVAEQHTARDGVYLFSEISQGPWTVVGYDVTGEQNSVIYSHVLAAPIA